MRGPDGFVKHRAGRAGALPSLVSGADLEHLELLHLELVHLERRAPPCARARPRRDGGAVARRAAEKGGGAAAGVVVVMVVVVEAVVVGVEGRGIAYMPMPMLR